ncbi:MAG: hypothetical protein HY332_24655 [Chloroflexi bacterium]|nr:hypothetical protein [Chloroflexota bacterium]
MASARTRDERAGLDLDTLTPEQAWRIWKPVSDEAIRRQEAGEDVDTAAVDVVAAELGVPLEVGAIAALGDEEQEAEAREWVNAYLGDDLP